MINPVRDIINTARRAIIYISDLAQRERWERACLDQCEADGLEVAALVLDADQTSAPDVVEMLTTGGIEVIVVGELGQLPASIMPRIIVAGERIPAPRRRPTIIRSGPAAEGPLRASVRR